MELQLNVIDLLIVLLQPAPLQMVVPGTKKLFVAANVHLFFFIKLPKLGIRKYSLPVICNCRREEVFQRHFRYVVKVEPNV